MVRKISNLPSVHKNRRSLRKRQTPQEVILWARLKNYQLGYKFRRQHSFGKYIVDFYCREKGLVIEVDGSQHLDQEAYDKRRTEYLNSLGLMVLRFGDNDINNNLNGVIMKIVEALDAPPPPTGPSPSKEGEG